MNRRGFLGALAGAMAFDPERLLWVPGAKHISIPAPSGVAKEWLATEWVQTIEYHEWGFTFRGLASFSSPYHKVQVHEARAGEERIYAVTTTHRG